MPNPPNPFLTLPNLNVLPPDHPARQDRMLTPLQSFAYPVLMWFFDADRNIGEGRTYLLAVVAIELARRGQKVFLEDLSLGMIKKTHPRNREYFIHTIEKIIRDHYNGEIFRISLTEYTLEYRGRHPK